METLIQKIQVEEQNSFACRTYTTPYFETSWHKHDEFEIILITEGHGTVLIGDYVGNYYPGDVFFTTGGMPHWYRKSYTTPVGSGIVLHFSRNFLGRVFMNLPEMEPIRTLLSFENRGLQIRGELKTIIGEQLHKIEAEKAGDLPRLLEMLNLLNKIGQSRDYEILTQAFYSKTSYSENSTIEKVFDFTFKHYLDQITLHQVAAAAEMSIPTFCRFFKKNIKKSYFNFLQELRIGHACKLLQTTNNAVLEICYSSGYNSWAHFSRQFKEVKKMPPSQYRKKFRGH